VTPTTGDAATGVGPDGHGGPPRTQAGTPVAAPSAEQSRGAALEDVGKLLETVAAPLGIVAGFLVFFGGTYSGAYFGWFGVNQRLLRYSIQDQMLQSAQPMFGTAVRVLALVVALWVLDRVSAPVRRRPDRLGAAGRAVVLAAAVVATAVGLLSALDLDPVARTVPPRTAAVVMLAGSVVLLRVRRSGRRAGWRTERAVLTAALLLAAFWVTTLYATEAGVGIARQIDRTPALLPLVTVFSERYVDLPGSTVVATEQRSPEGAVLYRYTGLRLLAYSDDRWFLLTGSLPGYRSTVTVLQDRPELRLEVARQR
jgi:hypothetical protein